MAPLCGLTPYESRCIKCSYHFMASSIRSPAQMLYICDNTVSGLSFMGSPSPSPLGTSDVKLFATRSGCVCVFVLGPLPPPPRCGKGLPSTPAPRPPSKVAKEEAK